MNGVLITKLNDFIKANVDKKNLSSFFDELYNLTIDVEKDYPNHKNWFYNKHLPLSLKNKGRDILIASVKKSLCGVAFVKMREEKKLCTLFVKASERNKGIGKALLEKSFEILGTTKPCLSVSQNNLKYLEKYINRYKWKQSSVKRDKYIMGQNEIYFNENKEKKMKSEKILLISIMSYYARQIFAGTKGFEFRKSSIREEDIGKTIYVYSAKDDKAIIGSFVVKKVHKGSLSEILKISGYDKREDKNEIERYFANTTNCYALELGEVKQFKKFLSLKEMRAIDPKVNLPQYWAYISNNSPLYEKIKNLK